MQDRKISKEARPAFQYVKLVENFIAFAYDQLKEHRKLKTMSSVLDALDSLSRTVQDSTGKYGVKPALSIYESSRDRLLGTPDSLDKQYEKAIKQKQKADEAYSKLPQQHEENLNKRKRLLQAKVEDMSLDQLKEIGIKAEKNQKLILDYEKLDLDLSTKRAELRKLDAKIQSHCCGGPLCNKDDLIDRDNKEHAIKVLISLQENVRANPVDVERSQEDVRNLKNQLAVIRKEIEDQIDGYDELRKKAAKNVAEATKAISDINQRIDAQQLEQCRVVDRDTMFNLVHLRARLSNFYRVVDKAYKDDASVRLVLDSLTSARNEWRDKFNIALGAIFYPDIKGLTGLKLYSDYVEWSGTHKNEQREIESAEYSPNEYIAYVVPEAKKINTHVLQTSTLGTVHDFFPAVDRVKKKKKPESDVSSNMAAARLTASTSSTHA